MKFIKKDYCSIDVGDTLYLVHDNNIVEKLTITENHITESSYMKPNEKVIDNLYLASNYYEIIDDGRLKLNTLKYIYPDHSSIPDIFKDTKLGNVFVDRRKALQFAENRNANQNFLEFFTEYPYILVYKTKNDDILETISTTNPLKCLQELIDVTANFKSLDINVDIAVFDTKKYRKIKNLEILNTLRKIIK